MFALRGLAVSLSVFVMVYCALSLSVARTWHRVRDLAQGQSAHRLASALFALRILPLGAAALITTVFAVPSFLLLEPRTIVEPIGAVPLALGIFGLAVVVIGLGNVGFAVWQASRTISGWISGSQSLDFPAPVSVLRIPRTVPAMTAVGIVRPRILLSDAAECLLDSGELKTALNHEIAHVRRRDNLKKLLLRFVVFPGMRELEHAWLEWTEMAADDAAVSNTAEALDLAAALIKVCRLGSLDSCVHLSMSLVHSPAVLVNDRVERLIHWSDQRRAPQTNSQWYAVGLGLAFVAVLGLTYSQLLISVHVATEWLVR
jgi:Zn-dependent protease with chaperone function